MHEAARFPRMTLAGLGLVLAAGAALAQAAPKAVPPELPAETLLNGGNLSAATSERIYVADVAISHIVDGRIRVFNATNGQMLGIVNAGYAGNFALSAKADELYLATTYLSRGGRGERSDILEVWDTQTLGFKYEVLLPPKRAQTLNYRGLVHRSANGRFVLVQNATPATSITVVDLTERKVASEVPTPGCWGIWPSSSHPSRFSMLCGDGKVATVTLDDKGQAADRQTSAKLFDADSDACFHSADQIGDRTFFVSFKGVITEVDLSGAAAKQAKAFNIVGGEAAKQGWRPGGYQPIAVHPGGKHAVVAMHDKGGEGSHKLPGKQLWIVDLETGKRVATAPAKGSVSLAFSKNGKRLQALDGATGALLVWQWNGAAPLKAITTVKPAGEAALHLETHD